MNKGQFVTFISENYDCKKTEAEKMIDTLTSAITSVLSSGEEISLVGFGSFSVSEVAARPGRNPKTGEKIQIGAYKQPKFKVGLKLKEACNQNKKK